MAIERTCVRTLQKPWGVVDLMPWSDAGHAGVATGEIWYERSTTGVPDPSLLLKLLFTSAPLSIQVHPNDAYARSIGLPHGKTEAWYVLSAAAGAKVALGLKRRLTPQQLREAVADGSIADLVVWQSVSAGNVISVPAGTIHAIGAGLIIAEIQQRSDATFRLFDYGRQRELHIESAVAVADAGPAHFHVRPNRFSDQRALLVCGLHFVFERIDLEPNSAWCLEAKRETWILVLSGSAVVGSFGVAVGNAVFAQADGVNIETGATRMVGLVAYAGVGPVPNLLRRLTKPVAAPARRPEKVHVPASLTRARTAASISRLGTIQ